MSSSRTASTLRTAHGLAYTRGWIGSGRPRFQLILGHAVGFSKETFIPTLTALGKLLEQRCCAATWIAIDFSGHGASRDAPPEPSKWNAHHADEIIELLEGEVLPRGSDGYTASPLPLVGFGWSMGGAVLANVEVKRPKTFEHVLMFEPPLFTRALALAAKLFGAIGMNVLANGAAKRRRVWPSLEAARAHLLKRSGKHYVPTALDAWVGGAGFRPHADGNEDGTSGAVELSCDPAYEARAYSWPGEALPVLAQRYDRNGMRNGCSFTLAVGEASQFSPMVISGTGPAFYRQLLAPHLPGSSARVVSFGEAATHMAPMEQPSLVAEGIVADLEARGLLPSQA